MEFIWIELNAFWIRICWQGFLHTSPNSSGYIRDGIKWENMIQLYRSIIIIMADFNLHVDLANCINSDATDEEFL